MKTSKHVNLSKEALRELKRLAGRSKESKTVDKAILYLGMISRNGIDKQTEDAVEKHRLHVGLEMLDE